MWDMSILQVVPGLRIAAPRDGARLRELLREAVDVDDAPTVRPLPQGAAVERHRGGRPDRRHATCCAARATQDVLIVAVGAMAAICRRRRGPARAQGIGVTVVDPRWVKPVDPALVELARGYRLVVSVEDNGTGRRLRRRAARRRCATPASTTPVRLFGIPQEFLDHGKRADDPRGDRPRRAEPGARHHRGRRRARPHGASVRVTPDNSLIVRPASSHAAAWRDSAYALAEEAAR